VEEIKKLSIPVKGHEDVAHVAAISSQDETIGELIAEAMDKVGKDGVITVPERGIDCSHGAYYRSSHHRDPREQGSRIGHAARHDVRAIRRTESAMRAMPVGMASLLPASSVTLSLG
jgi:hypothetical protein